MPGNRQHLYILIGLIIGALGGVLAEATLGTAPAERPVIEKYESAQDSGYLRDSIYWYTITVADTVGKIFLRLIFMVVLPLVFSALALGVIEIGDVRKLGRIGLRTLGFTLVFSMIAVMLGISAVNYFRPGERLSPEKRDALLTQYSGKASGYVQQARQAKSVQSTLVDIIPENPLQEMIGALDGSSKGNGMLAVMFFALIFGIALSTLAEARAAPVVNFLRAVFDACMVIIGWAMRLAPIAVACLLFSATARVGVDVLTMLLGFAAIVLGGLFIELLVVYPVALRVFARRSPIEFFRRIREVIVTAFATSSSNATLPTSLRCAEQELKLPREIGHFVLTVGATANQNGTALYEGVVVLFLAQVFGIDLSIGQQFTVVLMSILAGVGTAGVPGGSLPLIAVLCTTVGVPAEGIAIILGVDRILDMVRTMVNVVGDLVVATCVAWKSQQLNVAPA